MQRPSLIPHMPPEPWRQDPREPRSVLCADGNLIATAALWPGQHPTDADLVRSSKLAEEVAQAVAALPQILEAANDILEAWKEAFPDWADDDIADATDKALVVAHHRLRAALALATGLNADGSIPPGGQ